MALSPDHLTCVPESEFGLSHLRLHPVWGRFYEPSDIDIACSWGVDREAFKRELERVHTGSDHAMFPVLRLDPLPDDVLDVFVRASFTPRIGRVFDGYVSANANFICLYLEEQIYLSINSAGTMLAEEIRKCREIIPGVTLFPLRYSTPYRLADGSLLSGDFEPRHQ